MQLKSKKKKLRKADHMKIACLSLKVGNCQWDFGVGSFRGDTKC